MTKGMDVNVAQPDLISEIRGFDACSEFSSDYLLQIYGTGEMTDFVPVDNRFRATGAVVQLAPRF